LHSYNIDFVNEVDSTNTYLKSRIKQGVVKQPYAVSAGSQYAGKGQRGNHWESSPHQNILVSLLVSDPGDVASLSWLNHAAALSVVDVLTKMGVKNSAIKWPNDVYVGERKIAGILTENIVSDKRVRYAVIGIGLNVNQRRFEEDKATSISLITGEEHNTVDVLHYLYDSFYQRITENSSSLLEEVNAKLYKLGKNVTFERDNRMEEYQISGIHSSGNLLVKNREDIIQLEHHKVKWIH
jgi:BirA family biotin operon repressor/biotin-[acetyl-CoA-carboxylase] ligase